MEQAALVLCHNLHSTRKSRYADMTKYKFSCNLLASHDKLNTFNRALWFSLLPNTVFIFHFLKFKLVLSTS